MSSYVPPQPLPGLQMKPPAVTPQASHVIIGYEKVQGGECECSQEALVALVVLFILGIFFLFPWFFMCCVPCMCPKEYQRPIYGPPPQGTPYVATVPVYQQEVAEGYQMQPYPTPVPAPMPVYTATTQPSAPPKV